MRGELYLPTGLQVVQRANGHFLLLSSEPGLIQDRLTRIPANTGAPAPRRRA